MTVGQAKKRATMSVAQLERQPGYGTTWTMADVARVLAAEIDRQQRVIDMRCQHQARQHDAMATAFVDASARSEPAS